MKWKPYPKYKDLRCEYLARVPNAWSLERLRFHARINPSKSEVSTWPGNAEVSFVPMDAVHEYGGLRLDVTRRLNDVAGGYTYFRNGDVVVAKITPCFENGKGSIVQNLANDIGFGTTELHVIRPEKNQDCRFLFYLTLSGAFRQIGAAHMYGAGGQKRVPEEFVRDFPCPGPPFAEQRAIAGFLDRETGRIDALIEKKERQIELLQEKRAALISHAVTKGLDANARMKDSGIEWLGRIPAHWEIARVKHVLSKPLQYGANEPSGFDDPSCPRYVRITDIDSRGMLRDETFKSLPEHVAEPYVLSAGDLLFARSGATVGKTFLYLESWGRAAFAGYLIRARIARQRMIAEYTAYFCRSHNYWVWLRSNFIQATIQNVSAERYGNMVIPIPPIEEQRDIVGELNAGTSQSDRLVDRVSESMQLLREYRSALISAAVTGKIDVREEAA